MWRLHWPSASTARPHRNAKLNALHSRFRNLGLKLRNGLALFQPASASWTAGRQRYFDNFINRGGEGAAITGPIQLFPLPSRVLWCGLGVLPREGRRVALRAQYRFLHQTSRAVL